MTNIRLSRTPGCKKINYLVCELQLSVLVVNVSVAGEIPSFEKNKRLSRSSDLIATTCQVGQLRSPAIMVRYADSTQFCAHQGHSNGRQTQRTILLGASIVYMYSTEQEWSQGRSGSKAGASPRGERVQGESRSKGRASPRGERVQEESGSKGGAGPSKKTEVCYFSVQFTR